MRRHTGPDSGGSFASVFIAEPNKVSSDVCVGELSQRVMDLALELIL